MSLDIELIGAEIPIMCTCSECGNEHATIQRQILFEANITHNLGVMANEAGIYEACWRPEKIGATHAKDIIGKLTVGLERLKHQPEHFGSFNARNGWGKYEDFVPWVERYLRACEAYPEATIHVSR